MEWVETTGRTVEEALDAALDELGVDNDDVEFEVMEQPRGWLFGRLSGSGARVRARVKPISREKPGERQRRNRRSGSGQGRTATSSRSDNGDRDAERTAARTERQAAGAAAGSGAPRRRRGGGGGGGASAAGASGAGARDGGTGSGGRGGGRRPAMPGEPQATPARASDASNQTNKGTTVETIDPEVTIEEQAEAAEAFTQGLVDAFDLGAEVRSVIVDDGIVVDVTGDGLGLLVGPRGATLNAIEELVRTVVQRQTDGHGVRINVDVAGYRAKRREALEQFVRGIAERVVETGRPQALEPMSAVDRKVVHDTAAEIDGIETESEGEEPRRRVVLIPAAGGGEPD
jgi:spoIIIJ-associated protein